MRQQPSRRSAFLLVHLLFVLVLVAVFIAILSRVFLVTLAAQRSAMQHANALTTLESALVRLRLDAVTATAARFSDGKLTITSAGEDGTIEYELRDGGITRRHGASGEEQWESPRLRFEARVETGRTGQLLRLIVTEQAAPPSPTSRARRQEIGIALPTEGGK